MRNYIIGKCNEIAYSVVLNVLGNASVKANNPVMIYGAIGTGKTYLLSSVVELTEKSGRAVCFTSCEKIIGELLDNIYYDSFITYRKKYLSYDYVLIDDLQYVLGKESSQQEICLFIDEMIDAGVQIIVVSSTRVRQLPVIEQWMAGHSPCFVCAELELPDIETKRKIIQKIDIQMEIGLPDDVVEYLAVHSKEMRVLEGTIKSLAARKRIFKENISVEMAEKVFL